MTVTPTSDPTLEAFALYLQQGLNDRFPGSVAALSAYDNVPSDPAQYPHLVIHRTDAEGEALEYCRGIVRYLCLQQADKHAMPGQFRTLQLTIIELLRHYDDEEFRRQVERPQKFRCRERILGFQNGLIPYFEIEFTFVDFERVA